MSRIRVLSASFVAVALLFAAGCGGNDDDDAEPAGRMTVTELVADAPSGQVEVETVLFDDGSGLMMCEALMESFPPQCGGERMMITNPDDVVAEFTEDQGIRWTDSPVVLSGRVTDGGFTVDA